MSSLGRTTRRLLARLARGGASTAASSDAVVLTGAEATALVEARGAEAVAFERTAGADVHELGPPLNVFGEPRTVIGGDDGRAALAAGLGLAASGQRAAAFLSGPGLLGAQDLLGQAAGRHAPLVVHLACRAPSAHARARGTGHESCHAAAGSGAFVLFATNAQEAVDLALVARRASERALVPGVVAMDELETAASAQDVVLPGDDLFRGYLGDPAAHVEAATEAQRLLFGAGRRRVPRWHDLDRPLLLGATQGPEAWGIGAAGRRPFFDEHVGGMIGEAMDEIGRATGRPLEPLLTRGIDGARVVLVAQGAAVETALAVADAAGGAGVVGVRCLHPLPAAALVRAVLGAEFVVVLDRAAGPCGGEGPLAALVRGVIERAREGARRGAARPGDFPVITDKHAPRLVSAWAGAGGLPLRAADLQMLLETIDAPRPSGCVLGLGVTDAIDGYPKRQALADALRRAHPDLPELGVRSALPVKDVRPDGALTVGVLDAAGGTPSALAVEAAAMFRAALRPTAALRSRPAPPAAPAGIAALDVWTLTPDRAVDPGDDAPIDALVVLASGLAETAAVAARVVEGGSILLAGDGAAARLPAAAQRVIDARQQRVHECAVTGDEDAVAEMLLGALSSVIAARRPGAIGDVRSARARRLGDVEEERRDALVSAFDRGAQSVRPVDLPTPSAVAADEPPVPASVREFPRAEPTVDCVARFWDQTGVVYRAGETDDLALDPVLTAGAVPPRTSSFRAAGAAAATMLEFDPASCDGGGSSWASCPDGSVVPVAITPRALLDTAMDLAAAAGRPADALRGMAAKLARQMASIISEAAPPTAEMLLRAAFEATAAKTDLPDERRAALVGALEAVISEIGALPIARTKVFFDEPEGETPGSGAVFSLVIDPDAGGSPALAVAACDGRGLIEVPRTAARVERARRLWTLWHRLPPTDPALIERASRHADVGPLAAALLSRRALRALAGGDASPPGGGHRLALHRVLAIATTVLAPRRAAQVETLETLQMRLADRIRATLSDALPTGDLDALAHGLEALGRRDVDLAALSRTVDAAVTGQHVDGAALARLVEAARGLADLRWRLAVGADGAGRALLGLLVGRGPLADWIGAFPWNPLSVPAVIDDGAPLAPLARGIVEGSARQAVAAARLLRWAQLELDRPAEAAHATAELSRLGVADLAEDERRWRPPLLAVLSGTSAPAAVPALLALDAPVTVILLSDGAAPALDAALAATLAGRAYVVQTSIAHDEHFVEGLTAAVEHDGPALVHVHAVERAPTGGAVAAAARAVASRAFPLWRFDPGAPGVYGTRFDLRGNGDLESAVADDAPRHWRVLLEIAGVSTPFDERVRAEAARAGEERLAEEIERLRADYERRLAALRESVQGETAALVTERLMALAGYDAAPDGGENGA